MGDAVITTEDLGKCYRRTRHGSRAHPRRRRRSHASAAPRPDARPVAEPFWALRHVDLEVMAGQVTGIIGRNGAGKSTLLKLLSRITTPTEGRAEIFGRVGSLLEVGTGFHIDLTGRENVFFSGAVLGHEPRRGAAQARRRSSSSPASSGSSTRRSSTTRAACRCGSASRSPPTSSPRSSSSTRCSRWATRSSSAGASTRSGRSRRRASASCS